MTLKVHVPPRVSVCCYFEHYINAKNPTKSLLIYKNHKLRNCSHAWMLFSNALFSLTIQNRTLLYMEANTTQVAYAQIRMTVCARTNMQICAHANTHTPPPTHFDSL